MNRLTISFFILVGLLFAGIVIMIYPASFVQRLALNQMAVPTQPLAGTVVPREIIIFGSALTITGLVGISILGFRIFTESEGDEIRK